MKVTPEEIAAAVKYCALLALTVWATKSRNQRAQPGAGRDGILSSFASHGESD